MIGVSSGGPSLREGLAVYFRRGRTALALFALGCAATVLYVVFAPRSYRSEAQLFVQLGRESVGLDPTATVGQVVNLSETRENEINSAFQMLHNRQLVERIVDELGPQVVLAGQLVERSNEQPTPLERERAVIALAGDLDIEAVRKSSVLTLAYQTTSPELAQRVLELLIQGYLEQHAKAHRIAGSREFFAQQSAHLRTELEQVQAKLRELKDRSGLAEVIERRTIVMRRIGQLEDQQSENQAALAAATAEIAALRAKLADLPATQLAQQTTGPNAAVEAMRQQLYALQLKEQELRTKYQPNTVYIQEIARQIEEAQKVLAAEGQQKTQVTQAVSAAREQAHLALVLAEAKQASLEARRDQLEPLLATAQQDLTQINRDEIIVTELEREVALKEAAYRQYAEKLEQARIDEALEERRISNVNVVQPPTYAVKPVRPRKAFTLLAGLVASLCAALAWPLVAEWFDQTLHTPAQVEARLGLPVVASPGERAFPAALATAPRRGAS